LRISIIVEKKKGSFNIKLRIVLQAQLIMHCSIINSVLFSLLCVLRSCKVSVKKEEIKTKMGTPWYVICYRKYMAVLVPFLTFTFATGRCISSVQVHPFAILAMHNFVPYQYKPFWATDFTRISFKLPSALLNETIRHRILVSTPLSASQHHQAFFSFPFHLAILTTIDLIDGYGH